MKDACKTACKVCGQVFPLQRLRGHTKAAHGMVITEYKSSFPITKVEGTHQGST